MAKPKETADKKPPKKEMSKQKKRKLYWTGGGIFILLILSTMFISPRGSIHYGLCRTFIELNDPYPMEITPLSVDDFVSIGGPVKINFKRIDPFGVESVNTIECTFKRDAAGIAITELQKVDINGKTRTYIAENPDVVAKFNIGIPAILDQGPDLILPSFSLDNIAEYKDSE